MDAARGDESDGGLAQRHAQRRPRDAVRLHEAPAAGPRVLEPRDALEELDGQTVGGVAQHAPVRIFRGRALWRGDSPGTSSTTRSESSPRTPRAALPARSGAPASRGRSARART